MIKADIKMLHGHIMRGWWTGGSPAVRLRISQIKPDINYISTANNLYITTVYRFINGEGGHGDIYY